jgi:histidine triad (HIT) family protein
MNILFPELHQLFCQIVRGQAEYHKVDENDHFLAILDIAPVAKGHTLILSKRAILEITDLSDQEILSMHRMIGSVSDKLKSRFKTVGISIMQNGGACNSISYLHVHIIPRYDTVSIWKDEMFDPTPLSEVHASLS